MPRPQAAVHAPNAMYAWDLPALSRRYRHSRRTGGAGDINIVRSADPVTTAAAGNAACNGRDGFHQRPCRHSTADLAAQLGSAEMSRAAAMARMAVARRPAHSRLY